MNRALIVADMQERLAGLHQIDCGVFRLDDCALRGVYFSDDSHFAPRCASLDARVSTECLFGSALG